MLDPPAVETVTREVPEPGGTTTLSSDEETTFTDLAGVLSKRTKTSPTNPLPSIVTFAPPFCGPIAGVISVTVGGARKS